jgi:hypothetical protein
MVVVKMSADMRSIDRTMGIFQQTAWQTTDNMDVAWARVHNLLLSIEQKQFSGGGRRGPNPWAVLSPNTIARKRRMGLRLKKMHATTETAQSLRTHSHPLHVWRVNPSSAQGAEFGSRAKGFQVHQFTDSGAHFPYRPPVDLTDMDVRKVTRIIHDHVMSGAASKQGRLLSHREKARRFRAHGELTKGIG